jgi:ribosome-associated protein
VCRRGSASGLLPWVPGTLNYEGYGVKGDTPAAYRERIMLDVTPAIQIPLDEFEWSFARSGGPGGQNVNKVASKAVLRWNFDASPSVPEDVKARFRTRFPSRLTTDGELVLASELTRDQGRNREDCLEKLAAMLRAAAARPKVRRPTKPTKASQRRRVEAKRRKSSRKAGRRSPGGDE